MVGRIRYIREKGRGEISLAYMGSLTLMTAELYEPEGLSERRLEKRLHKLEKTLWRQGIGRVILPKGFPHTPRLKYLRPVEVLPFYRGIADVLALARLKHRGIPAHQGRVALAAPRLCPELREAAERLCPQVRELVIRVPEGGEDYARFLHGKYGLPVAPSSTPADVTVAFGPAEGSSGDVLSLYGEDPDLMGLRLSADGVELPQDCGEAMLALMWEAGQLNRDRLSATISPQTLANEQLLCYNY